MRRVEVLVLEGCHEIEATIEEARRAIGTAKVDADLRVLVVSSDEEAERLRFLGSPTVRVDGVDVEVSARGRVDYGLQCRLYSVDGRPACIPPPADWITSVLLGRKDSSAR